MALTAISRSTFNNTTASGTLTTATAFTPAPFSLMLGFLSWSGGDGSTPTNVRTTNVTDRYTFTHVTGAAATRHQIWVANSGATPPNDTISATFGGGALSGCIMDFYEITGADLSGTALQAIVQTPTPTSAATAGSGTVTPSITLAAAGSSNNRPLSAISVDADNVLITPRSLWTELREISYTTPIHRMHVQWRSDAFETTADATFTSTIAGSWKMSAVEIKAASGDTQVVGAIPI